MLDWDNDDDEFDASDFDGNESANEQAMREIKQEDERIRSLPLMKTAGQIFKLVEALIETLPDDDMSANYKRILIEDAIVLAPKIAAAEGADIYTFRMENAVIIKVAARNLLNQTSAMKMLGLSEPQYLDLLRSEIEDFRILFVAWVKGFDRSKDIPDNWGLFND
ncbi:MAG TPA: hypothetical protein PLH61_01890 [Bacteroidia bacterium]|nr:hypothetical protein [Bacteroidia bacterium]